MSFGGKNVDCGDGVSFLKPRKFGQKLLGTWRNPHQSWGVVGVEHQKLKM